jgi:predicted nucleic acid-binding protein
MPDTNILAEQVKPHGNPEVKAAVAAVPNEDVYLSVLTLGEIAKGIALLDPGPKKSHLTTWLAALES